MAASIQMIVALTLGCLLPAACTSDDEYVTGRDLAA